MSNVWMECQDKCNFLSYGGTKLLLFQVGEDEIPTANHFILWSSKTLTENKEGFEE